MSKVTVKPGAEGTPFSQLKGKYPYKTIKAKFYVMAKFLSQQ